MKNIGLVILTWLATLAAADNASAQANTALSNLTATSINQSLLVNSDNTYTLGATNSAWNAAYLYNLAGPASAALQINGQLVATGVGNEIDVVGGFTHDTGSAAGGLVKIQGGQATSGTGAGGLVELIGGSGDSSGGDVTLTGGSGAAATSAGGKVKLTGGASTGGAAPGNIELVAGGSASNFGEVKSSGHVAAVNGSSGNASISACGTSPSFTGGDNAGRVTVGSGTATCTITFAQTWGTTPACVVSDETARISLKSVATTTTLVISAAANFAASTVLDYICVGLN